MVKKLICIIKEIRQALYKHFVSFLNSPVKSLVKLSFLLLIFTILLQALYFYSWSNQGKDKKCPDTTVNSILYGKAFRNDCRKVIDRIIPPNEGKDNISNSFFLDDASIEFTEKGSKKKYKGKIISGEGHFKVSTEGGRKSNPPANGTSDILDHTSNILSNTSLLITTFSVIVFVLTVIFGFLGYKLLDEYQKLKSISEQNKSNLLDSAKMTLFSLPVLLNSIQTVPENLKKLMFHIKDIFDNVEFSELIDKNPQYEELRFVHALYFISKNDHSSARDTLETINRKTGIDDDLKVRTRYRLGIEYRAVGKYEKSLEMFSSIPDGTWRKEFGESTTDFVSLRSQDFEEFKVGDKKFPKNESAKLVTPYKNFEDLTKNNKSILSIQFLGAEFSAFAILKYDLTDDTRKKFLKLFINSFRESSKISEQQIGSSGDSSIECIWNYVYSLTIAQADLLLKDTANNGGGINFHNRIQKIFSTITQKYDDDGNVAFKVLDHVERVKTLIPKTDTFFSEMRQCNIGKNEFRKEFKSFIKVLEENVFNDLAIANEFKEIRKTI